MEGDFVVEFDPESAKFDVGLRLSNLHSNLKRVCEFIMTYQQIFAENAELLKNTSYNDMFGIARALVTLEDIESVFSKLSLAIDEIEKDKAK